MGITAIVVDTSVSTNNTGLAPGSGTASPNVTGLTCSGIVNPNTLTISLTVSFTPPSPIGNYIGVSLWLQIPAAPGANAVQTVSSTTTVASNTTVANGLPNPIFLQSFENPTLPLTVQTLFPLVNGLNPQSATPCTLYCTSNSAVSNPPVSGTTPSVNFTLEPSTGTNPTAATNVTTAIVQSLTVIEVGSQTVSGKMITGLLATVTGIPTTLPANWNFILVGVQGTNDPTIAANQQKLTGPETTNGPVPAPPNGDGFTLGQTSFVMQTPSASTKWTIYAVAGIGTNYNSIIPGQTCSCPLTLDSGNSGVLSAIDLLQSTISSQLSTATGKLGINPASLTSSFLAPGAAVGNLASSSIIAPLLAAGVAQTNLGIVSAAAIISPATITGTLVANQTITGSLLATSGIITSSAQVGTATIAAASIISLGVSQLTAGTATFSGTATFQNSSGPYVSIASTGILVSSNTGYVVEVTSSGGIELTDGTHVLTINSTNGISMNAASNYMTLTSSELVLSYGGAGTSFYPNVSVLSSSVYLSGTASDYIEITSGTMSIYSSGTQSLAISSTGITLTGSGVTMQLSNSSGWLSVTSGGATSTITGSTVTAANGSFTSLSVIGVITYSGSLSTATAGSATLPSNPVGFVEISVLGTTRKVPFYAV